MGNVIIIAILILIAIFSIRSGMKHFKGEGDCCGGGGGSTLRDPKKKLDGVIAKKTIVIEGMTCENCRNRVESSINKIDGASARVNLKKKTGIVEMSREVSEEEIRAAVEKAGYRMTEIR